jgi:hypothetical protein
MAAMAAAIVVTILVHYGVERVFYRPRVASTVRGERRPGNVVVQSSSA